jgi:hypothetical protein
MPNGNPTISVQGFQEFEVAYQKIETELHGRLILEPAPGSPESFTSVVISDHPHGMLLQLRRHLTVAAQANISNT